MLKENSVKILTYRNSTPTIFAIIICALFCFNVTTLFAETRNQSDKDKIADQSLHVISDKMVAQKDASTIEFIGNVKATRDDSIILADSIKVFFSSDKTKKTKKGDQQNLKKIIATGNVRYTAGERKAFGDKAVYTTEDGVLVLTGKAPKLVNGDSYVTGKKITLFRNEDRVLVESNGKTRVTAIFNPKDQKKGSTK
ncbi:MAG: hypothetical protein GY710_05135 [Desulfobacteraceae bacterium]|nr:hypothetical protein [Desulfobacteraceae bacterium]